MIPVLDSRLFFPNPRRADAEGLVAVGGDFSVPRLLLAYRSGIFPWTADPVTWWSPDPRGIFELEQSENPGGKGKAIPPHPTLSPGERAGRRGPGLHISRSLAKTIRKGLFRTSIDRAFRQVMEGCAAPAAGRRSTWITPEFLEGYTELHRQGHAHSLECWEGERLVGGVYGVAIGGFFAGESMFHRVSDASKIALFHLIEHLREREFSLFDIQMLTPITARLGGINIPRDEYLKRLDEAVDRPCLF
jgi:leucyl/phenylalanyl-tRNA--protein transferase